MKMASVQTMIYTGGEELHEAGIAITISRQVTKSLKEWTPQQQENHNSKILLKIQESTY